MLSTSTSRAVAIAAASTTNLVHALPPSRDLLNRSLFNQGSDAYAALQSALQTNANERNIKTGPEKAFHNHNAAHMISIFRCGGSVADIQAVLDADGGANSGAASITKPGTIEPPVGLGITQENWDKHLGDGVGLYGLGAEHNFDAYRQFYRAEIARTSADDTVRMYFPRLVKGMLGDFFHALIELGYYFESGEAAILPNALAWLSTSYVELPEPPEKVPKMEDTPLAALQAVSRNQEAFPTANMSNGSSGYIHDMETLLGEEFLASVYHFDVVIPADRTQELLWQIQDAARESFAAGGYKDFYTLHSVTGARAVWAIMNGIKWDTEVERDMLSTLWKGVLLTHIARNNCIVDSCDASQKASQLLQWTEILPWTIATENAHIVKAIFTFADSFDRTRDLRYWEVAVSTMQTREKGVALEGIGVGSFIDEYMQKYAREN